MTPDYIIASLFYARKLEMMSALFRVSLVAVA